MTAAREEWDDTSTMNPLLNAALDYAKRGWAIFPCSPSVEPGKSKMPLISGGFKSASRDPHQIHAWWTQWPDALIGVRTGRESGFWAVDPDAPKKPGEPDGREMWSALLREHRCTNLHTHTHDTPSGGAHVLFRWDENRPVTNSRGLLPQKIDIRGEGGYVVVPPSKMADGRTYRLREAFDFFNIMPAPAWLLDMVTTKPSKERRQAANDGPPRQSRLYDIHERYVAAALEAECAAVASAPSGERNNTLNRSAFNLGQLVGGGVLDALVARNALFDAAQTCGLVADEGARAALATIESGMTSGAEQPRTVPEGRREAHPGANRQHTRDGGGGGGDPPREDSASSEEEGSGGDDGQDRPCIRIVPGELPRIVTEAEDALIASGLPIFTRAGMLVRPVVENVKASHDRDTVVAKLKDLNLNAAIDILGQVAIFERYDARKKAWTAVDAPEKAAAILLSREGEWRLPKIVGVISTPTLRPDGSVLAEPGYDQATRLYLTPSENFSMPVLKERPTQEDARTALRLLLDLMTDCPFVTPVDRAVALSGIITPMVRGAMSVAPMHVFKASTPGSGKSYLVDICSTVGTGRPCPVVAAGKTEEETEKRLGGMLKDGVSIVSLDNCNAEIGGDLLCQIAERPLVRVRVLGKSDVPEFECRATIFATGNNATVRGDMVRRAIICSLDAGVERPELRPFKLEPIQRILGDRGRYVWAVLTIVRAYLVAGAPHVCQPLGSYGEWSRMVRAPLMWLGEADPVESMEKARAEDPELNAIRELFSHWSAHLSSSSNYTAAGVIEVATKNDNFGGTHIYPEFFDFLHRIANMGRDISSKRLGRWLTSISGRVVDGQKLVMTPDPSRGARYFLKRQEGAEPSINTRF